MGTSLMPDIIKTVANPKNCINIIRIKTVLIYIQRIANGVTAKTDSYI